MRTVILSLFIVLIYLNLSAQDQAKKITESKNFFSFEIGGAGVLGSVNYEHLLKMSTNDKILYRIGASYIPGFINYHEDVVTLPFGFYYLHGVKNHLELGLTNTISWHNRDPSEKRNPWFNHNIDFPNQNYFGYFLSPSIGYRYQDFHKKSIFYSIAYSPLLNLDHGNLFFQSWIKLGIGHSF